MLSKQALKSVFKRPFWASKMTQWSKIWSLAHTGKKRREGRMEIKERKEARKEGVYTH